jgi:hypothetical protein
MRLVAPVKHLVQCVGVNGSHSSGMAADSPYYKCIDLSQSYQFSNENASNELNTLYDLEAFKVTHARNFTLLGRLSYYGRLYLPESVFKKLKNICLKLFKFLHIRM